VGREVVRQLAVRGTPTIAHVRPDSRKLVEWRTRFEELGARVDTSPWKVGELAIALAQTDQLYICIGTTRSRAKSDQVEGDIYEAVDFGLTQLAVDAAKESRRPLRLVYLSSVGADAKARSAYLRARGKAENAVMHSGLSWAIARPSIITGDRDESRFGEAAAGVVGDGLLAVVGLFGGKQVRAKYRSTSPDVLASALIRIGESPEHDRIYDGNQLR
jgi:uncharacterized protein YbjT (DUF2867 family)